MKNKIWLHTKQGGCLIGNFKTVEEADKFDPEKRYTRSPIVKSRCPFTNKPSRAFKTI